MQIVVDGCANVDVDVHGTGLVVAAGRIATVAHVVAGATAVTVRNEHGQASASVVYFDPVNDVAVLAVERSSAPAVPLGVSPAGSTGTVVVFRDDSRSFLEVDLRRLVDIRTADMYGEGKHTRPGYELAVDIEGGDSGAVVVDGRAVALVWSRSRQAENRAWAMRSELLVDHLAATDPHGQCA